MRTITLKRRFWLGDNSIMEFEKKFFSPNFFINPARRECNTLFETRCDEYGILIEDPIAADYLVFHPFISAN